MIGRNISHYGILGKLGEGGMGVVYKAEDLILKRTVALKFLPSIVSSDSVEMSRFIHEAQAISALSHPNIATIYGLEESEGHKFIVLEYLEGGTLKQKAAGQPLPIPEVLDMALQIAAGLSHAHRKGIVHRDIKTDNVIVSGEGQLKITDFGLAKLRGVTKVTMTGSTVGTVAYMSPEQARGEEVDHRTDIWSLGVVLYELLTGQLPFKSEYEQATVYSILHDDPKALSAKRNDLPTGLEQIVFKAMAKNPDERYRQIDQIVADLQSVREGQEVTSRGIKLLTPKRKIWWYAAAALVMVAVVAVLYISTGKSEMIDSIAVLPLDNLSGDPGQEYIAEGMTDELITTLAQLGGLRVISRSSAMHFKRSEKSLREIARELNVDAIVEGTIMRSGDHIRVTAQLIRAATDEHLWARSYDRGLSDVLTLQNDIAQAIAEEIQVALTPVQKVRLASARRIDPEAYEAYLKGHYFLMKRTSDGVKKGIAYFQRAIEREPRYVPAYSGLTHAYGIAGTWGYLPQSDAFPKAKAAALRAMEIDSTLGESHFAMGSALWGDWNWAGSVREERRAIELSPSDAPAHLVLANHLVALGEFEEGIAEEKRALDLDPLSTFINTQLAWAFVCARRFDEAIVQARKALDLDSTWALARYQLGDAHLGKGDEREAVNEYLKAEAIKGVDSSRIEAKRRAFETAGMNGYWRAQLAACSEDDCSSHGHVAIYARLGDTDHAFALLEKEYDARSANFTYGIKSSVHFDNLREDPRYRELLKKLGMEK